MWILTRKVKKSRASAAKPTITKNTYSEDNDFTITVPRASINTNIRRLMPMEITNGRHSGMESRKPDEKRSRKPKIVRMSVVCADG